MSTQSSIVQVAQRAGVSVATASRVMSGSTYPVSEMTRQKVLLAAAALNYTPNTLARSLRMQRSKLIAILVGNSADPYFAEIMHGVEETARELGYLTIVCNTERDVIKEIHYLHTLRDYQVDGIIFAGGGLNAPGYPQQLEETVKEMTSYGVAFITLAQHTLHVPTLQPDNFKGAYLMTQRLLEMGHHRIAFIAGPTNLTVATIRLQGYKTAMVEAGIDVDPTLLFPGNFDRQSGEKAAISIAQIPASIRPTAAFAANDETAIGLLLGLRAQGIHVPENISVCGFGDLSLACMVTPALTTVHIPLYELGCAGARRLEAILKHEIVPEIEIFPTSIIERETTKHPSSLT